MTKVFLSSSLGGLGWDLEDDNKCKWSLILTTRRLQDQSLWSSFLSPHPALPLPTPPPPPPPSLRETSLNLSIACLFWRQQGICLDQNWRGFQIFTLLYIIPVQTHDTVFYSIANDCINMRSNYSEWLGRTNKMAVHIGPGLLHQKQPMWCFSLEKQIQLHCCCCFNMFQWK